MEYSKQNSNNGKDLKLTTGADICKVNNYSYSFGGTYAGLDDETIASINRKQEKESLLKLKGELLQMTNQAVNISNHGFSFIKASKPKIK